MSQPPFIPATLIIVNIVPYLDLQDWNHVTWANKEIYHLAQQLLPCPVVRLPDVAHIPKGSTVHSVGVSSDPSGTWIAYVCNGEDGRVRVWNRQTHATTVLSQPMQSDEVLFSPSCPSELVVSSYSYVHAGRAMEDHDGVIRDDDDQDDHEEVDDDYQDNHEEVGVWYATFWMWDLGFSPARGYPLTSLHITETTSRMTYSTDGKKLALVGSTCSVWSVNDDRAEEIFETEDDVNHAVVALSRDVTGRYLAYPTPKHDGVVLWDILEGASSDEASCSSTSRANSLKPIRRTLVACNGGSEIVSVVFCPPTATSPQYLASLSVTDTTPATSAFELTVQLWTVPDSTCARVIQDRQIRSDLWSWVAFSQSFSPDGLPNLMMYDSYRGTSYWPVGLAHLEQNCWFWSHYGIQAASLAPNGKDIVTASGNGKVCFWKIL
jgi:WD40 repeat protein